MTWRGNYGNRLKQQGGLPYASAKSVIHGSNGAAQVGTLFSALATYSDCARNEYSWCKSYHISSTIPGSGTVSVAKKAIVWARREGTSGRIRLEIPGIKDTYVEIQPRGKRLTTAALNAIVALMSTATGEVLTPLWSKVIDVDRE
jgi:hypothetical protein